MQALVSKAGYYVVSEECCGSYIEMTVVDTRDNKSVTVEIEDLTSLAEAHEFLSTNQAMNDFAFFEAKFA